MAELIDANEIMFTPFEPKLKNRFIMEIDGVPAYLIRATNRPQIDFETVVFAIIVLIFQGIYKSDWNNIVCNLALLVVITPV